jgi:Holliday junction resolvase RusA-like endonuclease
MILTEVWIPGHARTKGSLAAKGGYVQDTPQSKRWRALMAEVVRKDLLTRFGPITLKSLSSAFVKLPYAGPVAVEIDVWLPVADVIKAGAGDVDKLARNVLDAIAADAKNAVMNGGVIANDNQVIDLSIRKWRAAPTPDLPAGLLLIVHTAEHHHDTYRRSVAARVRGW